MSHIIIYIYTTNIYIYWTGKDFGERENCARSGNPTPIDLVTGLRKVDSNDTKEYSEIHPTNVCDSIHT